MPSLYVSQIKRLLGPGHWTFKLIKEPVIESPGGNRKCVTNIRAQHII